MLSNLPLVAATLLHLTLNALTVKKSVQRLRRVAAVLAPAAGSLALSVALIAQDPIARAKELYATAAYDEALAILEKAPARDSVQSLEYRILCLLALNRAPDAQGALDSLLRVNPAYHPGPSLVSPRTRTQIEEMRFGVIRRHYADAKSAFEEKDHNNALTRFNHTLALMAGAPDDRSFADLRVLATGFRDLAKGLSSGRSSAAQGSDIPNLAAPEPSSATPVVPFQGVVDGIYDSSAGSVVPPVPLKPILPPSSSEKTAPAPSPGLFEIVIDERGHVESAVVRRSINVQYDTLVLKESRGWRYRPATRDGRPVKFRKIIEIYTAPLRSIKRE